MKMALFSEFVDLAKKHRMHPLYLHNILRFRILGVGNSEIATLIGVNRNTVNRYVNIMSKIPVEEALRLAELVCFTERLDVK